MNFWRLDHAPLAKLEPWLGCSTCRRASLPEAKGAKLLSCRRSPSLVSSNEKVYVSSTLKGFVLSA